MIDKIYSHLATHEVHNEDLHVLLGAANLLNALTYCSYEQDATIKITVHNADGNYTEAYFNNYSQLNCDLHTALCNLINEFVNIEEN